jgi:hypothetical protein
MSIPNENNNTRNRLDCQFLYTELVEKDGLRWKGFVDLQVKIIFDRKINHR